MPSSIRRQARSRFSNLISVVAFAIPGAAYAQGAPPPAPQPMTQPPVAQPPMMQPPMMQPPMTQPPVAQPPMMQPPMMQPWPPPNGGWQGPVAPPGLGPTQPPPDFRGRTREPRPERIDWKSPEVIPPGYAPFSRPDTGLLVSGAVTFGTAYLPSFVAAWIGVFDEQEELAPLFLPIAGPLITIGTAESEETLTYFLVIDAVTQALGVALFTASFVAERTYLKRVDGPPRGIASAPTLTLRATPGGGSLAVAF